MRFWKVASLSVAILLFAGCVGNEPKIVTQDAQVCNQPKYTIAIGKINTTDSNVMSKEDFRSLLNNTIKNTNCFIVEPVLSNPKVGYTLDIEYGFQMQETKEDTSVISSKDTALLKSEVRFILKNPSKTITQNASNTMKLSGKKYLGLGEKVEVTYEQKSGLVKKSLYSIITNLSKIP